MTDATAAWALEQIHRLETAVRELNEQVRELQAELTLVKGYGRYRSGEEIECLQGAEDVGDGTAPQNEHAEKP